jgi:hypothetical protein
MMKTQRRPRTNDPGIAVRRRAQTAARVQRHWNDDLETQQRRDLMERFEGRLMRLFRGLGLEGWCDECGRIFALCEFEEDDGGFACPECGSTEVENYGAGPLNKTYEPEGWER